MEKTIEATKAKFAAIRAGRANVAMLDGVMVTQYGSQVPLKQVGTVSAPEPRMLVIDPWDKSVIKDIEKIESKEAKASPPNICKKFIISLSVNKYFIFFIIDYILLLKSTKNLEFFTNLISPVAINISTRIFL